MMPVTQGNVLTAVPVQGTKRSEDTEVPSRKGTGQED